MVILTYLYMDMSNSRDAAGIRDAALSVVNILATNSSQQNTLWNQKQQNLIGSGIIISEDGYILTNLHIINGKEKINVELDDRQIFSAKVIGYDERSDLSVIKIDVQGYEYKVLKGSKNNLKKINFIIIELSSKPNYKNEVSKNKIINFLKQRNFKLKKIYNKGYIGDSWQADFLFERNEL